MTTLKHETWESGTLGVKPTTTGSAFNNLVMAGFTYDNTHVKTGSTKACKMVVTGTNVQAGGSLTASDRAYEEIWLWPLALPTGANANLVAFRNVAGTATMQDVEVHTDGSIYLRNSSFVAVAHSGAGVIKAGQWNKIQRYYDTVAGQARLRVFTTDPDGNTPDYDTGPVATTKAGQVGNVQLGCINGTVTWTAWIDDYDLNDTGFLVPVPPGSSLGLRDKAVNPTPGSGANATIVVPGTVAAGDVMLLIFEGGAQFTQTDPAGWTRLPMDQSVPGLCLNGWKKTAGAGDHGTTVTVASNNAGAGYKRALHLIAFHDGIIGNATSRTATSSSAAHPTPTVVAQNASAWCVEGVADRASPGSQAWTLPSNLALQTQQFGSGGGAVSSVMATDDAVGVGTVGSSTITGTVVTSNAVAWTVAVEPVGTSIPVSVSAGPDVTSEPWRSFTIIPTASGAVDSWSWEQLSAVPDAGLIAPLTVGVPIDMTVGATVDGNGTIHLTAPAALAPMRYTLNVHGVKAGLPDATDTVTILVYPATRWFAHTDGRIVPLRVMAVT